MHARGHQARPTLKVGGALFAAGWRRPSDLVALRTRRTTAASSAPARRRRARSVAAAARATYTRPVPCPCRRQRPLVARPRGRSRTASHTVRVVAQDAAGNSGVAQRQVQVDGDAADRGPRARAAGRSIVIAVSDAASGVASVGIEVRNNSTEPYRTLPVHGRERHAPREARPRPCLPRRHSRDRPRHGGQRRQGNPTRLTATSAKVGRRFRKVRSGRVRVPFGRTREAARAPDALRRTVARGPDDRRDGDGPPARRAPEARGQRR